jgi:hypothetical protein
LTSLPDDARRRSRPSLRVAPRASRNEADDAIFLSSAYGLIPSPWQAQVLHDWMGLDRRGQWAASKCGLAVPRQNGKNGIIEIRELFGMVELGEKFLHTAHEVKTARKAFLRIASFFENERKYPELAKLVKEIRKTNGQEAVVLDNGGSVEFVARSKGSARGFTVDVLVCDEAQDLSDESQSALLPTKSAAPLGNPQTIFTGTPPGPRMNGEVWERLRKSAMSPKPRRLAFTDYGLSGPLPDVANRDLWHLTNPELGGRLHLATLLDEFDLMDDETFARERLGWWEDPESVGSIFESGAWDLCLVPEKETSGIETGLCFGLAVSVDREWTSIAAAGFRRDGLKHVEVVERRRGIRWAPKRMLELLAKHGAGPVVIDGGGPSSSLQGALEDEGVDLVVYPLKRVLDACAQASDDVKDVKWRHLGQESLDSAVDGAVKRDVGDRYAWGRRKSTCDISPLEAVTLAAFEADSAARFTPAPPAQTVSEHEYPDSAMSDLASMSF